MRSESQRAELILKDAQKRKMELNQSGASTSRNHETSNSEDEGQEFFEVEQILDMKVGRNGRRQFFVGLHLRKQTLKFFIGFMERLYRIG